MKIISFKNGDKVKISDEILDKLYESVVKRPEGAKNFQFFRDEKSGETLLVVNLSEISCIYGTDNA